MKGVEVSTVFELNQPDINLFHPVLDQINSVSYGFIELS